MMFRPTTSTYTETTKLLRAISTNNQWAQYNIRQSQSVINKNVDVDSNGDYDLNIAGLPPMRSIIIISVIIVIIVSSSSSIMISLRT